MKIPAECMSGLTVPVGLWWFHRVFPGQPRTILAFLHLKTVVQNASLEAELLGLMRCSKACNSNMLSFVRDLKMIYTEGGCHKMS